MEKHLLAVVEQQHQVGVGVRLSVGLLHRYRAGHAQMQRERPAAIERQHNPLGAAANRLHLAVLNEVEKLVDRRRFDHALPIELGDGDDAAAKDLLGQAARGVFNFG